jgi:predicted tellurium resistance membrane protein TerC
MSFHNSFTNAKPRRSFLYTLFSALVSGHPPMFKAILISIELSVNILLFVQLLKHTKLHMALALFLSIIASKLVYYGLKVAFINFGFVEGELITTNLWMQLGTAVFVTMIFTFIWIKSGRTLGKGMQEKG